MKATALNLTGYLGVQVKFDLACFKKIAKLSGCFVRVDPDGDVMLLDPEGSEFDSLESGDWVIWKEVDGEKSNHQVCMKMFFKDSRFEKA